MPNPIIIEDNNNMLLSPHPYKTILYNNSIKYALSFRIINESNLELDIHSTSSGSWSKELIISINDSVNIDITPDQTTNFSMHWLENKIYILFSAKYNHELSENTSNWFMQYIILDPSNWTYTFKTISEEFTMLPFEGPIIFDSVKKNDNIFLCFNYGENEEIGIIRQSIAFTTITSSNCITQRVYQQKEDILNIRLDYSDKDDILYMNYTGTENNLVYRIFPNIKLIDNQFDLDEVHLVTRMTEFLGFNAYIGFTKKSPRNISIHNTYFAPVPSDAHGLTFSFVKKFLVLCYFTSGRVEYVKFDLINKSFILHDLLYNDTDYSLLRDDGDDLELNSLVLHIVSDKFYELRLDIDIEKPTIIIPTQNKVIIDSIIEHIFKAPTEIEGNPLNMNITLITSTQSKTFSTDTEPVEGVIWKYNPSGDGLTWVDYPQTGSIDCFGKLVKVEIDRKILT